MPAILRTLRSLDQSSVIAEARRIAEQSLAQRQAQALQFAQKITEAQRIHAGWLQRLDVFLANPDQSLYSETVLAAKVRENEQRLTNLTAQQATRDQKRANTAAQMADLERFLVNTANWYPITMGQHIAVDRLPHGVRGRILFCRDR